MLTYAFGDQLVVHNNWTNCEEEREQSYSLEESLHGREILSVTAVKLNNGKSLVLTGSEDSYLKVCEFDGSRLECVQTFSNHVASIRALCKVRLANT